MVKLSKAVAPLIHEVKVVDEQGREKLIHVPGERPLTIYLDKKELVTLMTLGGAPEALVLGYLRHQGLVQNIEDIESVQVDWETESVAVKTCRQVPNIDQITRKKTVTTGCGQGTVFGEFMSSVADISLNPEARLSQTAIYAVVEKIRHHPSIYKRAGSVHACAVFKNSPTGIELLYFIEDVGRHNAVDAIAGMMWLDGIDGSDKLFYTTGRLTSEMVIKTAQMGIPFLVSRSGLTRMGWEIAQRIGISMIGRASGGKHYLLFTGRERFVQTLQAPTQLA